MSTRILPIVTVTLDKIVGGGQTIATMEDGRKLFVWGGLPGETVEVQMTKKKSRMGEGLVVNVITPSAERIEPKDPVSYLSTSPWQIMNFESEQSYKAALIDEAFAMHHFTLPNAATVYSDERLYGYRNKVEFSWYWNKETEELDLAFFSRGTHRKLPVEGTSLMPDAVNELALAVRDTLRKNAVNGFDLKTLMIRCSQTGALSAQLYVKEQAFASLSDADIEAFNVQGFEIIFSNPKSPASVITKYLKKWGSSTLVDSIAGVDFRYATESFFQVNIPMYERALLDMKEWIEPSKPTIDLYSGVGSIGLTIGSENLTMVEINESAVAEMRQNIAQLGRKNAKAVLAASEYALEYISSDATIIVDPPRAGLAIEVIDTLLEKNPSRIIYLSCNPVTQARDVQLLSSQYEVVAQQGYNFFPRTPHIEHLVVLQAK
jgi:23S rRNA (uracil1939-C5)-methyltransferase